MSEAPKSELEKKIDELDSQLQELRYWAGAYKTVSASGGNGVVSFTIAPPGEQPSAAIPLGEIADPVTGGNIVAALTDYTAKQFIAAWTSARKVCDDAVGICNAAAAA